MRIKLLLLTALLAASAVWAQSPDTKGKEFIFTIPPTVAPEFAPQVVITSDQAALVTVEIPGLAFFQNFAVAANGSVTVALPVAAQQPEIDTVQNRGVRVTANQEVSVLVQIGRLVSADTFRALPVDVLGKDHLTVSTEGGLSLPAFSIAAAYDGTTVEITPTANGVGGHPAGVPFVVNLNRLQAYTFNALIDLDHTGSVVRSNKPIAVISGHRCGQVPAGVDFCNSVYEQLPATTAWGTYFLAAPFGGRAAASQLRILARDDGTQVRVNGFLVTTLDRAQWYDHTFIVPTTVETSKPALVSQFSQGYSVDNIGDPAMTLVTPVSLYQKSSVFHLIPYLEPILPYTDTRVHIIARTAETGLCRIDNAPFAGPFTAIGSSGYSTATQQLAAGPHTASCPSGFDLQVYAWLDGDAYASPAGFSMVHISAPRCDVNLDGKVDSADINLITAARNTSTADPTDPRDADGDMQINVVDARACVLKCNKPGCAQ